MTHENEYTPPDRARSAALDEILGQKIEVLDDGFVRVVDYMGNESSIVQAARVSYGAGTKSVREDVGLIRHLMRNRHTSPFEQAEIKLHVRVPMDTWRQWIRHRTACLSGDTLLHFDHPAAESRGECRRYNLSVEEIYERFQPTTNATRPDKQRNALFRRDRIQGMFLRCVDEETLAVSHTHIVDIWKSGERDVFLVETRSGQSLKMSADHRCFTDGGWKKLSEFAELPSSSGGVSERSSASLCVVSSGRGSANSFVVEADDAAEEWRDVVGFEGFYEVSSFGRVRRIVGGRGSRSFGRLKRLTVTEGGYHVTSLNAPGLQSTRFVHHMVLEAFADARPDGSECRHLNGNRLDNRVDNLAWGSAQDNADDRVAHGSTSAISASFDAVERITHLGREETFDLEVEGPWHNFVAGGVVVHNSVNEYSTRYSVAIDSAQRTLPSRWRAQSSTNKQGSGAMLPSDIGQRLTYEERDLHRAAREAYDHRLEAGVAREQARKDLPLSTYSEAYWKIDLHNLLHFLSLRMDAHAQEEIRSYAKLIGYEIVRLWMPNVWKAFEDFRLNAVTLSGIEAAAMAFLARGSDAGAIRIALEAGWLEPQEDGWVLAKSSERTEFEAKLERLGMRPPWQAGS